MTTTALPPIGSVWVNMDNPHDIVVVTGHDSVLSKHSNVVKIHKILANYKTQETIGTFTWIYKPLETK
jgi:hypothetical protein